MAHCGAIEEPLIEPMVVRDVAPNGEWGQTAVCAAAGADGVAQTPESCGLCRILEGDAHSHMHGLAWTRALVL